MLNKIVTAAAIAGIFAVGASVRWVNMRYCR